MMPPTISQDSLNITLVISDLILFDAHMQNSQIFRILTLSCYVGTPAARV